MKFIFAKLFNNKSISKVFLLSLLSISIGLIVVFGLFMIQQENQKFKRESQQIQEDFIKNQKKTLQQETQTLINYIENERLQTRNLLKKDISSRVYEAHSIATNLYKSYKNQLSKYELQRLIINALQSVRFNNGDGFFYINNLNGTVVMDPENPDWVGRNKLQVKDVYGVPIIQSEIETAKRLGEGYTDYSWQAENSQKIHPKISFVKLFKEFNWYIGCTQYVNHYKLEVQEKVLDKITDLRFDDNFTIAVISFDGSCLAHTNKSLIGKNLWPMRDGNGNKIVQEFISRGTDSGGGFIEYLEPFANTADLPLPKLTHAKAYKDWQWVVGSGIHLQELNHAIEKRKSELQANVNRYIYNGVILLVFIVIFIIIFSRYVVRVTENGLIVFTRFFEKAASESLKINTSSLQFKEFKELGTLANQMITKRESIEQQLNIETAYFEQLFENSPEAIAITDNESKGIKINKKFTELFGYTSQDIKGVVIDNLLADKDRQEEATKLNSLTANGQLVEIETKRKCKTGEMIDVSIVGNPIVVDKKPIAIFGIYRDITQRKLYEKHLTEAKNKAEESDLLKSAFLANMSHEIRTPMNHIIGFTDIMTSQHIDENERHEYGELIKQSSNNLLQLINDIIDLSKIESRQIKLNWANSNLNGIISSLYEKYNAQKNFHSKGHININVQKPLCDKDSMLYTDAKRLEQLLSNLIENAIKFTDEGFVEFGYQVIEEQSLIELFVRDSGIGIAEEAQKDIFKSFTQIDGSDTRQHGGTGLGLTITHRLTEVLGGKISLESVEKEGTCFYIRFPFSLEKEDELTPIKENAYNWRGKKILIVDDQRNNFAYFKTALEHTHAEIYWAKNGIEAISLCESVNIDIVLMDIQMPVMNGYEATKKIKHQNAAIPIIGQTAFVETENKKKAIAAGCDDYLVKPVKTKTLLDSINKQFSIN
ncbi:cache domain-containing protein [Marinifilum caeruleilacunae]|uniref:histidine kinase n=1 Tax=Marinifilum caeruleilacunae TaxID=2499076 RepID=A0ABX1WYG2_9BACT|nr:cache domain-containing protein [Marinifilum caeruleilacunae]NOU60905.1 response regulator [Marinifilum caeruleilacunae]